MAAASLNLAIEQGTTWRQSLQWLDPDGVTPINMNGCTAFAEFRETVDSDVILLTLSTENSRIEIDVSTGTILLKLTAEETAAITWTIAQYDLEVHFPAINGEVPIYRLVKGKAKVSPEITRG